MRPQRVVLFGASGFLGGPLGAALASDPRVGELVRVGRQNRPGWVRHDLAQGPTEELRQLLADTRPDVVISAVGKLAGGDAELVEANVSTTARLLDAVAAVRPAARLVVLGSAAEYGVVPVGRPVPENAPIDPVSVYGLTKAASTRLVRLAVERGRVRAVALRVFNPVGPGTPTENMLGRAAACMRTALDRGDDHIELGALHAYRDFVDVRDVASAIRAVALALHVDQPVLNVGSGSAVAAREAVHTLAEVAGFSGEVLESAPAPARSRDVNWIAADIGTITRAVGWAPAHDLRSSARALWAGASTAT